MKFIIFTLFLLLSFIEASPVLSLETPEDIIHEILNFIKGFFNSLEKHGEKHEASDKCLNRTKDLLDNVIECIKFLKKFKPSDYSSWLILIPYLANTGYSGYLAVINCIPVGPLFVEMVKRLSNKTAWDILERILLGINKHGEELWNDIITFIDFKNLGELGTAIGDFIEQIGRAHV